MIVERLRSYLECLKCRKNGRLYEKLPDTAPVALPSRVTSTRASRFDNTHCNGRQFVGNLTGCKAAVGAKPEKRPGRHAGYGLHGHKGIIDFEITQGAALFQKAQQSAVEAAMIVLKSLARSRGQVLFFPKIDRKKRSAIDDFMGKAANKSFKPFRGRAAILSGHLGTIGCKSRRPEADSRQKIRLRGVKLIDEWFGDGKRCRNFVQCRGGESFLEEQLARNFQNAVLFEFQRFFLESRSHEHSPFICYKNLLTSKNYLPIKQAACNV
nr:hypothetical protein [Sulfitobacter pacificus]